MIIITGYFCGLAAFFGLQIYLWWVWKYGVTSTDQSDFGQLPFVSILIPIRNEELNIAKCLNSVSSQNYPKSSVQVIVINDHSTDGSREIVKAFEGIDLIDLPQNITGKKMAIQHGIMVAKGEILLTIDGDCMIGEDWLVSMVSSLPQETDSLLTGPVWMIPESPTFIQKYQEMEQAALNVLTYSGVTSGLILSASGANMAYSKSLYSRLDPYADNQNIPSGDDVFFAQKVFQNQGKVRFAKLPEAVVFTNPVTTFSSFVEQRMRWAGKSSTYSHGLTQLYLGMFGAVNLSFVVLLIAGIWHPFLYSVAGLGLLVKFLTDYLIISTGMRWGQRPVCWQDALKASLFQVIYVNYIALLMVTGNKFSWKGRNGDEVI